MVGNEAQVGDAYGDRLRKAFDEVVDVSQSDRRTFIEARFAADPQVRNELLGMLEHLESDSTFIEPPEPEVMKDILDWTSTDPESAGPQLRTLTGTTIAGRYALKRLLGSGGAGVVYEAEDKLGNAIVAVKILRNDTGEGRLDQRWEATALRLLRLPGVVQLIDEGESEGLVYLVTELVDGVPFPGRPLSSSWDALAETALALLETLDRVHWAGIVHRDLKPGNVLVDVRGRPYVLDLGIAQGRDPATNETSRSSRRGTLGYMAPEQLRGEPATVRSDLYSVGVMLHEALAGARFRSESSVRLARFGLISEREKPLAELEVGVPESVQSVLTRMLQPDPLQRPASAREVLDALLADDATERRRRDVPFVGRQQALDAVLHAARAGSSLDVAGEDGSGRTRLLREAAARLESEGRGVLWLDATKDKDAAALRTRLDAAQKGRAVVFVDDADAADDERRALVDDARGTSTIVRAVSRATPAALPLSPLGESDLRALFAGPDRLLHLKEDGARELWARTHGLPRAVVRELDAWSRAGLGWWHGRHYHLRRRDLDVLERGLRTPSASVSADAEGVPLDAGARELTLVVELAAPRATLPLLAQVLERPPEAVAAQVDELEAAGWIRRMRGDTLEAVASPPDATDGLGTRRSELHRRIALALAPGDERRLFHWVAAGTMEPVPAESIAVASSLLTEGHADAARAIAREGLRALTDRPDAAWQAQLLELDLLAAIRGNTTRALDEVLQDLGMTAPSARVERLERIARGALRALGGEPQRVLEEVPVPDGTASELEARAALSVRAFAGRTLGAAVQQQVLAEAEKLGGDSDQVRALVKVERAWLAYREGRFADAAADHLAAADVLPGEVGRNGCLVNAASAYLEAGMLDRAEQLANEALAFARERRLVPQLIRAEWLARSAAYRRGDAMRPDVRLAIASGLVGMPRSAGPIHLNEAAIAWRCGRKRTAERLARSAASTLTGTPGRWPRLLAGALAVACSAAPDEEEAAGLLAECRACPSPRLAIQAAGLLARTASRVREEALDFAASRSPEIPASDHEFRREILSAAEAVQSPTPDA